MLTWRIWISCPQMLPALFSRARLTRPIICVVERLDGLFDVIRLSMVESEMEARARMHLLQLLELRAGGWHTDDTRTNFYKSKCRCLGMKVLHSSK